MRCLQSAGEIRASDQARSTLESLNKQLENARRQEAAAKAVLDAQRRAARSGELLTTKDIRGISQSVLDPEADEGVRGGGATGGLLGGLFGGAVPVPAAAREEAEERVCCLSCLSACIAGPRAARV
jgi:hypothetical protein